MTSSFDRMSRDAERLASQFRFMFDPPAVRMFRESQLHYQTLIQSLIAPSNSFAALATSLNSISSSLPRHLKSFDEAMSAAFRTQADMAQIHRGLWTNIDLTFRAVAQAAEQLADLASLPDRAARVFAAAFTLPASMHLFGHAGVLNQESFGAQLRQRLEELDAVVDEDDDDSSASTAFESLVALFIAKCGSLVRDPTHFYGMLGILLSVVLWVYSSIESRNAETSLRQDIRAGERQTADLIERSTQRMIDALESLRPSEVAARQRAVLRQTALRQRPHGKARAVRMLYPNEIVEQIDAKGTWIQIRAFDYVSGEATSGWVLKKYTTLIRK